MKISVVVPLYNKRDTALKALNSVLSQTVYPEEIIVVNDGSTDGSEQVIFKLNNPLIKLFVQPNSGVSAARNKGIEEAKGDWIAFLDADDEWMPEFLETIESLSAKYPECSILSTSYMQLDFTGIQKTIILKKIPFGGEDGILTNYFEVAAKSHPPICSDSLVVKKSAILSVGKFPVRIKAGEDLLTWAKLAVNYKIAYSIRPLSVFVLDPAHSYDKKPNRVPQTPDIVGNELKTLAKHNRNIPGIGKYLAHWFKMRASIFLRLGMKKQALSETIKSLSFNPFNLKIFLYLFMFILPISLINIIFRKFGKA